MALPVGLRAMFNWRGKDGKKGDTGVLADLGVELLPWNAEPYGEMTGPDEYRGAIVHIPMPLPTPETVNNDIATEALLLNPTATQSAAKVLIAQETIPVDDGQESMTALDQKRSTSMGLISDSIWYKNTSGLYVGTDGNEVPKKVGLGLAARYPSCEVGYRLLASGAPVEYGPRQVLSSGYGAVTVFEDTFDRAAADMVGTTPNVGAVWGGSTGRFNLPGDGSATGLGTSSLSCTGTATAPGHMHSTFEVTFSTTATGTITAIGSRPNASTYLMLRIQPGTDVVEACTVYTNTVTVVKSFTFAEAGIPSTGNATVTLSIDHQDGQQVVFKVGTATYTHALTTLEEAAYVVGNTVVIGATIVGTKFLSVKATIPVPAAHTLEVRNASMGSRNAQWSTANIAALLPDKPDVVIVGHGANHGAETPEQYLAVLDDLVAAIRALHGNIGFAFASESPEYAPAANAAEHNARMAALRRWCRENGFGYIPVYEAFMARPIPQALVRSDGVHPTAEGIDLIAAVILAYLVSLSMQPVV